MHTRMHTHTHMHTYTHLHTYTHTHTQAKGERERETWHNVIVKLDGSPR